MIYVYALYTAQHDRLYIGMTNDMKRRFHEHNSAQNKSTKAYVPWVLIFQEEFNTRAEARVKEKEMKSTAGRRFLRKLI